MSAIFTTSHIRCYADLACAIDERSEMDFKLELVLIPVSDVDRAKAFYVEKLGFDLDVDYQPNDDFRVVQLTPPGSACSIAVGKGITGAEPGSYRGTHLVVTDIEAARDELTRSGVEVSGIRHMTPSGWVDGVDPEHSDYESFADFADPDGNTWVLQEVRKGKTQS
jgi:catechol 2,3-dioxygenase-like lactoylglutathione lyase family enzyme